MAIVTAVGPLLLWAKNVCRKNTKMYVYFEYSIDGKPIINHMFYAYTQTTFSIHAVVSGRLGLLLSAYILWASVIRVYRRCEQMYKGINGEYIHTTKTECNGTGTW